MNILDAAFEVLSAETAADECGGSDAAA